MTLKTSKLRDAITFALVVSAASAMGTGSALAQEAAPAAEEAETLDVVVVTGTRIRSQTITAASPVAEVQAEEFQYAGATRVEDLINQYPQLQANFDSFQNNGAQGYETVDLRGLGADRTLVLVNGNRLPPGAGETRDISIIPAALIKRVDILTGGASAVYGSDAIAGVVNFILDDEFEGFSASIGYSAYQHNNDNEYIRPLLERRNFEFPEGDSGFDGISRNVDLVIGGEFADGAGHATAWVTWRENEALLQGQRDYSACALNAAGTACGGSATAPIPNFFVVDENLVGFSTINPDGTFRRGTGALYNYAPINFYQRPDERRTFGTSISYEVNEHFQPYIEAMFVNRKSSSQIAESGTFFADTLNFDCADPIIGTFCADLGLDPAGGFDVYVGKRNVEGGPRLTEDETSAYRFVVGAEGELDDFWSYNVSLLYGHNQTGASSINDFLRNRIVDAIRGCPEGSFAGCVPYNVFEPGGVTPEAAAALSGVGMQQVDTSLTVAQAYVTGDTGFVLPWVQDDSVEVVAGAEWRKDEYSRIFDTNFQEGNFAGAGGPRQNVAGEITVSELFAEAAIPLARDAGFLESASLQLGYRLSDYSTSGTVNTYKIALAAEVGDYRVRGGYNRAIRAPGVFELFFDQQIALFPGDDPCAGANPEFTFEQCARTGVTADQFGTIPTSPASQYNQLIGGNLDLEPEVADTWTFGIAGEPFRGFQFNIDYFDIKLEDTISSIGANTVLRFCGLTGDPFLCDKVNRNPATGDLFLGETGFVSNLTDNFGELHFRGIDVGFLYGWEMLGGRFATSFQGTYMLEQEVNPLPGVNDDAVYDCAGVINTSCQTPEWRHIASLRYSRDWFTVNARWRYTGALDYVNADGEPLTTDRLLCAPSANAACLGEGELEAQSYFDLSASAYLGENTEFTVGVNNILDDEPPLVGSTLAINANAPGGYDQAGRFIFASLTFTF